MRSEINLIIILFIYLCFSCKNSQDVSKSKIFEPYYFIEGEHTIVYYEHFIFIGNNVEIGMKEDTSFLLNKAMQYVDTVSANQPVISVIFLNGKGNFSTDPDRQDWSIIRRDFLFEVNFSEDSLISKKYSLKDYYLWKDDGD